jgi:Zn-dependent protease with chaperone function
LRFANDVFTSEEVERARRYHRPLYAASIVRLLLGLGVPALLAFTELGDAVYRPVSGLHWAPATAGFSALAVVVGALAGLPLSLWRYRYERRYGFSTQGVGGWLGDAAKALAVGCVLTAAMLTGLVASARLFPSWWPLAAAAGGGLLVLVFGFVAPVVLEPVFNRFRPLADEKLAGELRSLSARAGVPVRDVLVADASRRTRKHNAYVSGLGRTRRVVLWDTLLEDASPREIHLVTAHELAHRRFRHVAWWTVLGIAGIAAFVLVLWAALGWDRLRAGLDVSGAGDPRIVPFVLLLGAGLELVAMPFGAALSRRFERAADRYSLELTGDSGAYEEVHRRLATANLADLDPPHAYYLAFHGHPTPPERIAAGRAWVGQRT